MLAEIMNADIFLSFSGDSLLSTPNPAILQKGRLMESDGVLYTLLVGGNDAGYHLTAVFKGKCRTARCFCRWLRLPQ